MDSKAAAVDDEVRENKDARWIIGAFKFSWEVCIFPTGIYDFVVMFTRV